MKRHEGDRSTERRSTRPENMENENLMCRPEVAKIQKKMKQVKIKTAACECGEPEQAADHIINSCPLYRPPSEAGLFKVGPLTRAWLQHTELTI